MYGDWLKVKPKLTLDLVCTGLLPGVGKYWGKVGSIRVATREGIELARVSGMSDEIRDSIRLSDIGRVCEVAYERLGSQGRLRHPRFVMWRDDKTAEQCDGQ
jgi:ATP-dependent DNA ligase